jgi:hypothetical protein
LLVPLLVLAQAVPGMCVATVPALALLLVGVLLLLLFARCHSPFLVDF